MRLDDLRHALRAAEEAEDTAMVALASYGSRGGADPAEFDALLKMTVNARAATASAYAALRAVADHAFAAGTAAWARAPSASTNVYPFARRRETGAASPSATHAELSASMGVAKAVDRDP
jgi:hypothetical protein